MAVITWLSPDDWHLSDDCRLMTTIAQLHCAQLNYTTNISAFKHQAPIEYPDEHPSQQTLSRWAIQKVWSVKSNLCSSAFRYLDITTHYHLKLQANLKQNCPKNETKLSCGSFLKFLLRLSSQSQNSTFEFNTWELLNYWTSEHFKEKLYFLVRRKFFNYPLLSYRK